MEVKIERPAQSRFNKPKMPMAVVSTLNRPIFINRSLSKFLLMLSPLLYWGGKIKIRIFFFTQVSHNPMVKKPLNMILLEEIFHGLLYGRSVAENECVRNLIHYLKYIIKLGYYVKPGGFTNICVQRVRERDGLNCNSEPIPRSLSERIGNAVRRGCRKLQLLSDGHIRIFLCFIDRSRWLILIASHDIKKIEPISKII